MNDIACLFLVVYGVTYTSVVVHELFHFFSCCVLRKPVSGVYLGSRFLRANIWKVHISPVISQGHVEIESGVLSAMAVWEVVLFFVSGALGNFLLALAAFLVDRGPIAWCVVVINLGYAFTSLLPHLGGRNDMSVLLRVLSDKKC